MKKLFFLIVSMVVIGGVSAQVTKTIKSVTSEVSASVPQKVEKEPAVYTGGIPSYFNHSIMENVPMFSAKKPQKAENYRYWGEVLSTEYAYNAIGDAALWPTSTRPNPNAYVLQLFPDSLVLSHTHYTDVPAESFNHWMVPSIGFMFDPYSKAFDKEYKYRLFQNTETGMVCGYSIDTLWVWGQYRIAESEYDENSPDTLRIFLSYYNVYGYPEGKGDPKNGLEYLLLTFTDYKDSYAFAPFIKYDNRNNIAEKGPVTMPKADNTVVINHVLSLRDTVQGSRLKSMPISIKDYIGENFAVPVGSVTSVIVKYVPGYDYNKGDTVYRLDFNKSTDKTIGDTVVKNLFRQCIIDDPTFANFLDPTRGVNGRLLETKDIRYGKFQSSDTASWNKNGDKWYNPGYAPIPYIWMGISTDDDEWDLSVKDPNPVVSKIYPNPANNQVKIELINDETAELSIVNMLGQVVNVATLNEMDNTIDVSSLSSGIYMLKISQGGNVYTTKFIKR